jgi:hypothetical protein
MPSLHPWPSRHGTRHPPQLARSLEVSTHFPKQNIWSAGHCRACAFTEGWVRHRSRLIVSAPTQVRRRTCSAARPCAWPAGRVTARCSPNLLPLPALGSSCLIMYRPDMAVGLDSPLRLQMVRLDDGFQSKSRKPNHEIRRPPVRVVEHRPIFSRHLRSRQPFVF